MKLASLKQGRDGRLVVVSKDLTRYTDAGHVAPTLQAALDTWDLTAPNLAQLAEELEVGSEARNVLEQAEEDVRV